MEGPVAAPRRGSVLTGNRRTTMLVTCGVLAVLGVLILRVYLSSRAEVLAGDRFVAERDVAGGVLHYGRAVHWYLPGNGWVPLAYDRLWNIAVAAEGVGDPELALEAYREIRRGVHATRSVYFPHEGRLHAANDRIAALMASSEPPPVDAGKSTEALYAEHLELLQRDLLPDPLWSVVVLIGFFGWLAGMGLLVWRGFDAQGMLQPKPALLWGVVSISAGALWIVGMVQA